ncbi:hypothetical protein FA13DRAFT_1818078 [Coprinellus micaceus]|uniref:BTB domain-containing protein n=1 Tax=Coprinellus micaceus TaxID=71717 RepID=A0A4Y7SQU0_COPMI|nr:hypothetical protein FA13DRAFT_1818078 [Coprinellus micaceus]
MPKRRRVDDGPAASEQPEGAPVSPLKRSEEVWFDDGNIVLQAGDKQFKVHRGVLAKHSPIFSDLFQIPHPHDEPTVDGCPIVELHDSPEDVEHVLKALYGLGDYLNSDLNLHISVVAAMIRLGRKYEIPHLSAESMRLLKREYPTTLEENDELDHHSYHNIRVTMPDRTRGPSDADETEDETEDDTDNFAVILGIVKLAHECHIQSILPALYLQLTRFPLEDILRPDTQLPLDVLWSCICGRDKLLNVWRDRTHAMGRSEKCFSKADCKMSIMSLLEDLKLPDADLASILQPWDTFAEVWDDSLQSLCEECTQEAKELHEKDREATWTSLPELFKLSSWDNLKNV